jgi:gliding motility-associated-like protein
MYKKNIYFLLLILLSASAMAQPCISVFPFRETFEATNGGWTTGGTASDWAWGTPAKTTITGAGEGTKCWITGGLTGSSYNNGERSWAQSPCFNFTTLVHPRVSFKVFWETELGFDGADMQYSTDGGTTWLDLGSINSNSNCLGVNWYNSGSIRYLSNKAGWAGNIQTTGCNTAGGGSGGWLTASHDLGALAGLPNVSFRFEFGAGTQCNSFDGFAFDDFNIFESTPNTASFSYTCKPALTVDFTTQSVCSTSSAWTFSDAASGANTSSSNTPEHIFSAAGTYTVTLTSTFASGPPSTVSQQITVLDVNANLDHPVSCNGGSDAVLTATAIGSSGYTYVWNTNPPQTGPSITTGAGDYTVTVTAGTSCPATTTIIVTDPAPLTASPVITAQKCSALNGAIVSNINGGATPYNYVWSNTAISPDISGLAAGDYSLLVTDANNCIFNTGTVTVPHDNGGLTVNLPATVGLCPNQTLILNPGVFSSYLWQDNSTSPTYTVTATGLYSVTVTDANGCTAGAATNVVPGCTELFFPSAFTPNGDTKNEMFGPAGNNFFGITDYQLNVYDRYGELAFHSTDPYKKWDGTFKGKMSGNTTFVWMASYRISGHVGFQKGTVTLIR